MMTTRVAEAEWRGDVKHGSGTISLGSGVFSGPYSFGSRFENVAGTNPEELIAAAHAGCFSMALALMLGGDGHPPGRIRTTARVTIDKEGDAFKITSSVLDTVAEVPGIDDAAFAKYATMAKNGCPVSKALAGVNIVLNARLVTSDKVT
jgi:lipoyl-dependent peroxiredoxin